ncbi:MAG: L-erythro-3,5-diaminohexanoate dehydrogenase [Clostridium sp.]|jgi:L-erythro-3,5-diaminohexanoate dehydrogenase|uniref:L-erythro-3,5-diaminohexanoate dehydrogenase n=1 Tax=Clostridium sp. TaxID=1506 RepID=UPI0025BACD29|nr:L-erythro-3,5-diaminohexanoate dehydrogenase [Clostridium sp.]MCH3964389.1 L-erythro-3,5-diaminohexanoate dehydrogenase [Clostridium sp.]MCI1715564.1 L-erythro-3,5-diaminohexanoate dehydrogenase [Clostridium sp.]MCI1799644.1 L-erythro-3,5-diaminohexanoate dehydrogenase [Clostridium sp.]MCI1813748.1 L-erythro-3,5-diaminohexanoate dehydrogenase [Clostridium sp.]MCI1870457.1 L-erythro-3,5-diaminohexanoate dehydrogenase [Clostridium sp.]
MIGRKYGIHRVIDPEGVLPQAALKISNDTEISDDEILIDVQALNIDSASFTQIEKSQEDDVEKIKESIMKIVEERGKMQNPVTGSGGMLIGTVERIGKDILPETDLEVGDRIATLVSLSLTPLKIYEIKNIYSNIDRVEIDGKAVLFESGLYVKLPEDMSENLALAVLDVAGAPAQTSKMVEEGDSVLVLGGFGKSGVLCCYEAKKRAGSKGKVVGLVAFQKDREYLIKTGFCDEVVVADAANPMEVLEKAVNANDGREFDIAINCVNVQNTEMSTILPVKDGGMAYFFSMATSFTKAALGAEGAAKDVKLYIGNGYTRGHAEMALNELKESEVLRKIFEERYS